MAALPDNVLAHWSTLVEGLGASAPEFYADVETAVERRMIPGATLERIEYRESGALSSLREYLRIRRQRHVFDVCGAPFGNGFFFSWWLADEKPTLSAGASILIVLGYLAILWFLVEQLGFLTGPIVLLILVPLSCAIVDSVGSPEADDFMLKLPLIGRLYERLFRPLTYYRLDTAQMFQKAVQAAVMEVVDEITSAKGVRALSELERKPVMRDFFRK
jgi:hypothetical protein